MQTINFRTKKFKTKIMKTHTFTEQQLFDLLRNSFVAGEFFAEDIQAFEWEEVEKITEPDFDEWYKGLKL